MASANPTEASLPLAQERNPDQADLETEESRRFHSLQRLREIRDEWRLKFSDDREFGAFLRPVARIYEREENAPLIPRIMELLAEPGPHNFSNRQYTREEISQLITFGPSEKELYTVELSDRAGWHGLVGVMIIAETPYVGKGKSIEAFCMSPNGLGIGLEKTFIGHVACLIKERGVTSLMVKPVQNTICYEASSLCDESGFGDSFFHEKGEWTLSLTDKDPEISPWFIVRTNPEKDFNARIKKCQELPKTCGDCESLFRIWVDSAKAANLDISEIDAAWKKDREKIEDSLVLRKLLELEIAFSPSPDSGRVLSATHCSYDTTGDPVPRRESLLRAGFIILEEEIIDRGFIPNTTIGTDRCQFRYARPEDTQRVFKAKPLVDYYELAMTPPEALVTRISRLHDLVFEYEACTSPDKKEHLATYERVLEETAGLSDIEWWRYLSSNFKPRRGRADSE